MLYAGTGVDGETDSALHLAATFSGPTHIVPHIDGVDQWYIRSETGSVRRMDQFGINPMLSGVNNIQCITSVSTPASFTQNLSTTNDPTLLILGADESSANTLLSTETADVVNFSLSPYLGVEDTSDDA